MTEKATIILQNSSCFKGYFFGRQSSVSGELVFNTGMTGYVESLTDPSYWGQILVFTYPLIGNYGAPDNKIKDEFGLAKHLESEKIQVKGVICSDYSFKFSHFKAVKSLSRWLEEEGVPGVYGIDTRKLTKELRQFGAMPGKILKQDENLEFIDPNQLDLIEKVSIKQPVVYRRGEKTVALIDCGAKLSIIKSLLKRGISVIRAPYNYDLSRIDSKINGVVVSNGPGDPQKALPAILNIKRAMAKQMPILGICLGSQLLAIAAGGETYKLKFGHRGQNQPCLELGAKRCYITSQNHGFAVKPSLPSGWRPWFLNANDNTIEGIKHSTEPFFGIQFHPEASPGPTDTEFIFDQFVKLL